MTQSSGAVAIPNLPGFDTESALKLLANNVKLYRKVLDKVLLTYEKDLPRLEALLIAQTDWEAIQREAHTIKGLAGTIGHPALQDIATQLDAACKNRDTHDAAYMDEIVQNFVQELRDVVSTLKVALA